MKFSSVVSVNDFFAKVNPIFNLSLPGAFSLLVPDALSNKDESFAELIKDSLIVKPILAEGLPEYFSIIIFCCSTLTKKPLVKITPSDMFAILALPCGSSDSGST